MTIAVFQPPEVSINLVNRHLLCMRNGNGLFARKKQEPGCFCLDFFSICRDDDCVWAYSSFSLWKMAFCKRQQLQSVTKSNDWPRLQLITSRCNDCRSRIRFSARSNSKNWLDGEIHASPPSPLSRSHHPSQVHWQKTQSLDGIVVTVIA